MENKVRSLFEITSEVAAYKENSNGDDSEPITVRQKNEIFAADQHQEKRLIGGKPVDAVLFTLGLDWYWMPRNVFNSVAVKTTAADRTGTPFKR
jgi:hypothetical protein